jgi:murein DD-endopeptidase MepM/ murein hydrolase activator NlpD
LYTQYTHLDSSLVARGDRVERGQQIGMAGDRATRGNPHLHFTAFTAEGFGRNRKSIAPRFADGYDLPEIGGCNQHGGTRLTAAAGDAPTPPQLASSAEMGRWYREEQHVRVVGGSVAGGIAYGWNAEPAPDAPRIPADTPVLLSAAGAGMHTLYVRGWDAAGRTTITTFGPIGYDVHGPAVVEPIEPQRVRPGSPLTLSWVAAQDGGVGTAGYRVYVGDDPAGSGAWYITAPTLTLTPPLGRSLVRVQPIDALGNAGAWTTLTEIVVMP